MLSQYQLKRFKYNSHYWILRFFAEEKRPLRILAVGSADGYLGVIFERAGPKRASTDSSCRIRDLVSTPLPIQPVFPITGHYLFAPMHELHYLLVRTWRTLFAYQFVLRVTTDYSERL